VKGHRLALLAATCGSLALAAFVPAAGCNGTGTTPMCDFPDGANNPESGCGVLVEAAASDAPVTPVTDAPTADSVAPTDSGGGKTDASDATVPDAADAHVSDTGTDAGDAHTGDAKSDGPG
jgi:hypothetical protein